MQDEALIDAVGRAQAREAAGDLDAARTLYEGLWAGALGDDDHHAACVAAHFMAHTQDGAEGQLAWHLRALRAAEVAGDERVRAFYPSLHANLAEVYLRLGDIARARAPVERASASAEALQDDGYGRMIGGLIRRLELASRDNPESEEAPPA